jgi:hypothetical protein
MYKYLINKDTNIFFTEVTRDIFYDNILFELLETDIILDNSLIKPKWTGTEWIDSETLNETLARKTVIAIQIDLEYTGMISDLMRKHMEKFIIDGVSVPQAIIDQRDALRLECNNKIAALGITDYTYRIGVKGL